MKLFILLFSLCIGVQTQSLEDLNNQVNELKEEHKKLQDEILSLLNKIRLLEEDVGVLEANITVALYDAVPLKIQMNYILGNNSACQRERDVCLNTEKNLDRESNEAQNNLKLLEPELQELRLKLNKCTEEIKYCKSVGKEKIGGGGFINKIVTSTLDKVQQLKKGVANTLRSKINWLKFNVPE